MATQELVFKISATDAGLRSVMTQARAEIAQTARIQEAVNKGELSMRQQQAAAASLQRQRSAALISQWKQQEAAARQLASGIRPVSENLQRVTDVMQSLRASTATLEGPLGGIAGRLGSIATLATEAGQGTAGAAVAIGGLAAAAIAGQIVLFKLHTTLFDLAKGAAEWRGALFDTSQQLGISTETLSAFEILAKTTGSDLGSLSASLGIFQKNLEDAQDPTSKEAKLLAELGIEVTNTEDALRKTLVVLAAMPEGFKQTATALELFGRGGKSMLAILKEVDGDLDGAIAKFRELGLIVSREDAKAADQFNDELALLHFQFRALLGKDGIPGAIAALKDLSRFLKENKDAFDAINFVAGVTTTLFGGELSRSLRVVGSLWRQLITPLTIVKELYQGIANVAGQIAPVDLTVPTAVESGVGVSVGAGVLRKKERGGSGGSGRDPALSEQRLAVLQLQRTLANIAEEERVTERSLKNRQIMFEAYAEAVELKEAQRHQAVLGGLLEEAKAADKLRDARQREIQLTEIDNKRIEENNRHQAAKDKLADAQRRIEAEISEFIREQAEAIREAAAQTDKWTKAVNDLVVSLAKQGVTLDPQIEQQLRLNAQLQRTGEILREIRETLESMPPILPLGTAGEGLSEDAIGARAGARADAEAGAPPQETISVWDQLKGAVRGAFDEMVSFGDFADGGLRAALEGMKGAAREGILAWALYGEAMGKAFKKALAGVLASIAAEAAVQALLHAAYAIGRLAFGDFAGAGKHAIAAAKFTAVAVATGIGARIVGGGAAANGAGQASGAFNSATGGGRGDSASSAPKTTEADRRSYATQPIVRELRLTVNGDAVIDRFVEDFDLNGRTRIIVSSGG